MPKGGRGVRMKMPNTSSGALQASLARMQAEAAKQQDLLVEEKAEHSGVVTNVAPTINSQTGAQQNYPSWFNGDQRHRSMVIYPIYMSAEKSVAQGRRVPKSLAVSRPKSQEILDILTYAGYKCVLLKDKLHPKDNYKSDPCNWGRVHLEFKGEDGNPILHVVLKKYNRVRRNTQKIKKKQKTKLIHFQNYLYPKLQKQKPNYFASSAQKYLYWNHEWSPH